MSKLHGIAVDSKASQDKWELEELLKEVARIDPKNILEIGVHLGGSMRTWKEAFNPKILLGIERDTYVEFPEDLEVWKGCDSHDLNILDNIIIRLKGDFIDFLFIDGDHSYSGVEQDFQMYSPLVRPGGIVAFHDVCYHHDKTEEVDQYWNFIKEKFPHRMFHNPSGTGTGVGVLYL